MFKYFKYSVSTKGLINFKNLRKNVKFYCEKENKNLEDIQKINKIIEGETEESTQEKYKDFMKTQKHEDAARRKIDRDTYKVLKNTTIPFYNLSKVLLQRNFLFLKKKTNTEVDDKTSENSEKKTLPKELN